MIPALEATVSEPLLVSGRGSTALTMRVGEEARLRLQEMGSAGYLWNLEASALMEVERHHASPAPRNGSGEGRTIGAFTEVHLRLVARAPGTVQFIHRRPWETGPGVGSLDITIRPD